MSLCASKELPHFDSSDAPVKVRPSRAHASFSRENITLPCSGGMPRSLRNSAKNSCLLTPFESPPVLMIPDAVLPGRLGYSWKGINLIEKSALLENCGMAFSTRRFDGQAQYQLGSEMMSTVICILPELD